PGLPKPAQQPRPPVIIGGGGQRRTPMLAARYADEYNRPFASIQDTAAAFDRVRAASAAVGRAETSLIYSTAQVVWGRTPPGIRTPEEISKRAAAIGREPDELREHGLAGTPGEIAAKLGEFASIGASRVYLQVLDLHDLDHLDLLAELIPAVR